MAFEQLARCVVMHRAEAGISQEDLARQMGAAESSVTRVESGQYATDVKTLKRLAQALGDRALIGIRVL